MDKDVKNLFLDSNIWLDIYHFSADDLIEFSKLKDAINKDIVLYMPNQVIHEINRNRDNKIADAYKKFQNFKLEIPNFCKGYSEYNSFMNVYNPYVKAVTVRFVFLIKQIIYFFLAYSYPVIPYAYTYFILRIKNAHLKLGAFAAVKFAV